MDDSKTPCTTASWKYLGGKNYYQNATCFQLDTGQKTLSCGDPKNEGTGEPSYQYASENVPTAPLGQSAAPTPSANPSASAAPTGLYYPKGSIVMINNGAGTNGGQFMIVYDDNSALSNSYSIVGTITKGLDLVQAIAAGGATDTTGSPAAAGDPDQPLTISAVSVADVPAEASDTPSTTPSATPTSS
jgi:peptidyl-prolyl cis-trans isomerase B (cyclophilin B)